MKIKRMIAVGIACCMFLSGCSGAERRKNETETKEQPSGTEEESTKETESTEEVSEKPSMEQAENAEKKTKDWKEIYLEYLDKYEKDTWAVNAWTYSLIYVNEDDIPELVIDSGIEAGGCEILTYYEGAVDVLKNYRLNFDYIEKGNRFCNSDGNMGSYYDYVYTIENGKWTCIGEGRYGDGENGVQQDENGDFIYVYSWEGESVDEQEYAQRLSEVYDKQKAVTPQNYYILREMRSLLKTGEGTSAKHRYELITGDLTWEEAQEACKEKGGYLATISSVDEFQRIEEQIAKEGKTNVTFWVGGKHLDGKGLWGYYWLEQGENHDDFSMNDLYDAYRKFWLEGEPSYSGLTESGEEIEETCLILFYRTSDERAYLNDVPNDILAAAPSYAGRIGYICEYDEE